MKNQGIEAGTPENEAKERRQLRSASPYYIAPLEMTNELFSPARSKIARRERVSREKFNYLWTPSPKSKQNITPSRLGRDILSRFDNNSLEEDRASSQILSNKNLEGAEQLLKHSVEEFQKNSSGEKVDDSESIENIQKALDNAKQALAISESMKTLRVNNGGSGNNDLKDLQEDGEVNSNGEVSPRYHVTISEHRFFNQTKITLEKVMLGGSASTSSNPKSSSKSSDSALSPLQKRRRRAKQMERHQNSRKKVDFKKRREED